MKHKSSEGLVFETTSTEVSGTAVSEYISKLNMFIALKMRPETRSRNM